MAKYISCLDILIVIDSAQRDNMMRCCFLRHEGENHA
jgi:hypothetical protein